MPEMAARFFFFAPLARFNTRQSGVLQKAQMKKALLPTVEPKHIPTTLPNRVRGFRVSIRITHPEILPELITRKIGRTPAIAWAVGDQRITPAGTVLPGLRKDSYWVLNGPESDDLAFLIDWANGVLQDAKPFVQELLRTGGRLEYFIGCFINGQLGTTLEPSLLAKCAELGVMLGFDMYGEQT
jgi:hypothetical protein